MNRQRIFNRVCKHLMKQGRRASQNDACRLRADNGDRCAIGCLIPNSVYHSELEGCNILHWEAAARANPRKPRFVKALNHLKAEQEIDVQFGAMPFVI